MTRILKTGILGATGAVGQKLLQLLENHPLFQVTALYASEKSAGKAYRDAVTWRAPGAFPEKFADLEVAPCRPGETLDLVFSALPKEQAREVEPAFAAAGIPVVSNASAFRMGEDIPLVIPELNPDHTALVDIQRKNRGWSGYIVTNPNCATIGLALPLSALDQAFGVEKVNVVTMQARSGAGYPGPPEEVINDNVLPYIGGEEDKLETEPKKILGVLENGAVTPAPMILSAACHRVDVIDGHFEAISVAFKNKPASADEVEAALASFQGKVDDMDLYSSPDPLIQVHQDETRPQPKLDRMTGGGMTTHVGRIRPCPVLDYKMVILSHNTIRGAAGAALLNGELLAAQGLL
ncbi:MAG: aspartate-semialdehyde dehydrogenase [Acidobacteriota bacterium]|nr:aspartate-semialdehyde dehydrogenase [Acidobacteriota bacterium]